MDWLQVLTIIGSTAGLFFWARSESNADRRETNNLIKEIKDEMKDFHGRLCTLEERYLQIITRKWK